MNIFKQFAKSLYSPKSISMFRFQGIGKTILYVFLLTLLATLPMAVYMSTGISGLLKGLDSTLQEDLPDFKIEEGTLIAETAEPLEFKKDDLFIVFDPTGAFTASEIENKQNGIGLLKNEFVYAVAGQAQSYDYSMLNTMTLTKEDLSQYSSQFENVLPIVLSVVIVMLFLFTAASKFIEITFLAIVSILFKNSLKRNVNFKQLWVMSAYAVTLATVFFFIMEFLQVSVPSGIFVNWFVNLIMLYLALKEIPAARKK
ncbi:MULTISPECIES: DUF1189 domain-containing protein [Metabacillus]|uniref:DUF1189 domain-containing protein n=1 Tax=Metabacillus hrfriensis TaxID=3048891 RepID=A0ACD4R7Z7_9BACI|nr:MULTISPECIES: DUF1189 domain-containing protein [Metabacillus]UAL51050.1 DUF1189 domain-containing protein [Metabacillus dongyingensis]USK27330.1 DUF1189 domain-containing protein [Bacillus sp. CMF21]WHZ56554.1 DUF1189 domain-containing protein [Metabacillus sp. CT-WN-B3]